MSHAGRSFSRSTVVHNYHIILFLPNDAATVTLSFEATGRSLAQVDLRILKEREREGEREKRETTQVQLCVTAEPKFMKPSSQDIHCLYLIIYRYKITEEHQRNCGIHNAFILTAKSSMRILRDLQGIRVFSIIVRFLRRCDTRNAEFSELMEEQFRILI